MSLPPSPRPRLPPLRLDTLATGLALTLAALLIGLGLAVSLLTWRRVVPAPETTPLGAAASAGPVATDAPAPPTAERRGARVGRLLDDAGAEDLARQLQEAPHGHWAYALRSSERQQQQAETPAAADAPAPRRIISVVPESALGFAWPLTGAITSAFTDAHPLGIDIAPAEMPGLVLAARAGVVVLAGGDPCCSYGYVVMLDHGGGLTSLYGHLREPPLVRAGERLERGTVLGYAGETGHAEGIHLHFEVRLHGVPVDPEVVLTGGRLTPLPLPRPTPAATPTAAPAPRSVPAPVSPPASTTPESVADGIAPEVTASPSASSAAPAAAAATSPSRPTPTTTPPPGPLPSRAEPVRATPSPSPQDMANPDPRAAPLAAATASGASSASTAPASPAPSATPGTDAAPSSRCETVRLPRPDERSTPPEGAATEFIRLEADATAVRSLVVERCQGSPRITIIAAPVGGRRCSATLTERDGDRSRRLIAEQTQEATPAPAGDSRPAAGEVRWLVALADLWPEPVVRVNCVPAEARMEP